jgi:hypothetical protein
MKTLLLSIFILSYSLGISQEEIQWDGKYQLQLSDFQSSTTQIGKTNISSIYVQPGIEFSYNMSNVEFMFTKNFNSKVKNIFRRSLASIIASDSASAKDLLGLGQYLFDLSELYARKFRKKLYEEKGTFSNPTYIKPLYDEIANELSSRSLTAFKETELGKKRDKLAVLHKQVKIEIEELSYFCITCKPKKK